MSERPKDRIERLRLPRLARELKTIEAMVLRWCRDQHPQARAENGAEHCDEHGAPHSDKHSVDHRLCRECSAFMAYAARRLACCPYGEDKPACGNCQTVCYGPRQREEVRQIMRYAGPRMATRHPWLTLLHFLDGRRPMPPRPRNRARPPASPPVPAPDRTPPHEAGDAA